MALPFPGIWDVEHVCFGAATAATSEPVQEYFQQTYDLGRHFDGPRPAAISHPPTAWT